MIVSASYKTDIPAFYGHWFMNRLRAGYCKVVNPYNQRPFKVLLNRDSTSGFVFWTKNVGPFVALLNEVRDRGFPFIVQYSINSYPRELEFSVTDPPKSIAHMKLLAREFGSRVPVWRYDPLLISTLTDERFHLENFRRLCELLEGCADEVVFSFLQLYDKTRRNLDSSAARSGFTWKDPIESAKKALLGELGAIAMSHGFSPTICSQPSLLTGALADAHCIDASRLSSVAGHVISSRPKGNRPSCACDESKDIGEYDTCPHGCVYCYAVRDRTLARTRYNGHDPNSEYLFPPLNVIDGGDEPETQLTLLP